jgi:7-cyano-7-deazaguanine synthase
VKTLVICSGGLDSATLAHKVAAEQSLTRLVSFDYGQRHRKELDSARACAARLGAPHDIVDISAVRNEFAAGQGRSGQEASEGHYAQDTIRITVVPNRNAIMLAIAFGIAASEQAEAVAAAVHGGDHFIYPDCRPDFVKAFETMQRHALEGLANIALYTPFVRLNKADIVREGARLDVPFADTWSCYQGGERHCGRCGTCVERREAVHLTGIDDPTVYEDPDYWIEACREHQAKQPS